MCIHPSIRFLLLSLLIFVAVFTEKASWQSRLASLTAGFIISCLNTLWEAISAKAGFYTISGPLPVLSTPLPMFISWAFLAASFAFICDQLKGKWKPLLLILIAIPGGWAVDFALWKWFKILHPGRNASPAINAAVWVILVPLTVIIKSGIQKFLTFKRR